MTPWFIATEKFDQSNEGWDKYIAWSGLEQLDEVVSLDSSLCPTLLPDIKTDYWNYIVNEDFMLHFFTDLDYLRREVTDVRGKNLLCVFRNPTTHPVSHIPKGFEFVGYDLMDKDTGTSAITNCGGFPEVFFNSEISEKGLFRTYEHGREVQETLRKQHPEEHHADCHLWAIFRWR